MKGLAWCVLSLVVGCGVFPDTADASFEPADAGGESTDGGASKLPFGATCAADDDCESTHCFQFGNGQRHCSVPCTSASECPSGSQGQKCNNKGFCAY